MATFRAVLPAAVFSALLLAAALPAQPLAWTERPAPGTSGFTTVALASGPGLHVALGGAAVAVSTDTAAWTRIELPVARDTTFFGRALTYADGLFVAAGASAAFDGLPNRNIYTSPDGRTWTPRTTANGSLSAVAGLPGRWIAVGAATEDGRNAVTSTDGLTWTRVAVGQGSASFAGIVAHPLRRVFVAWAGDANGNANGSEVATGLRANVWVTADGTAWTRVALPDTSAVSRVFGVAVSGGALLAAVRVSPASTRLYSSDDGLVWTPRADVAVPPHTVPLFPTSTVDPAFVGGGFYVTGDFAAGTATAVITGSTAAFTETVPSATGYTTVTRPGGSFRLNASGTLSTWTYTTGSPSEPGGSSAAALFTAGRIVFGPVDGRSVSAPLPVAYLSNLSVLARAGAESEMLTVGVTVGGGTGGKSVLVRGIGPTLAAFGVAGSVADPVLRLFRGTSTLLAQNDDWSASDPLAAASAAVGAFALPPGSRDAVIFGPAFPAGGYVVEYAGKSPVPGPGLVELYDADRGTAVSAESPRLTNLAARSLGGTGAATLIVGFNVAGHGALRVLVRASGPALAPFGLAGLMPDPRLDLFAGDRRIDGNDDWSAATRAAQDSVGAFAFPAGSKDAVLIATLSPGSYTAQVTPGGGTPGVALVEVYELP